MNSIPQLKSRMQRHLKAHNFCDKGVFLPLFSHKFDDQLSWNFDRFVILCMCKDTPSEKTSLWQLPKVSNAFKVLEIQYFEREKILLLIYHFDERWKQCTIRRIGQVNYLKLIHVLLTTHLLLTHKICILLPQDGWRRADREIPWINIAICNKINWWKNNYSITEIN